MKLHLAMLAVALAASAGLAAAEETTRVYRQGNSTATITQSGGGSTMTRRTVHGPDSQTIIQRQAGSRVTVRQSVDEGDAEDLAGDTLSAPEGDVSRMQIIVSMTPEEQQELEELALDEDTTVQALVEEAIQDFLDRTR